MKLSEIAKLIDGQLVGEDIDINNIRSLQAAGPGDITLLMDNSRKEEARRTKASAIVSKTMDVGPKSVILVDNPRKILVKLMNIFETKTLRRGLHPSTVIDESSVLSNDVWIDAFVRIGKNVKIGSRVQIHSGVSIGDEVVIGDETVIFPNVVLYAGTTIGDRCILHGGCVIGADGFGFEPDEKGVFQKVPQLGRVIIQNDVEVGANTCIDRGTLQDTIIGAGTKLDNLIQVGHNSIIGKNNVFSGMVAIGGSTTVGDNNMWGGQTATAGHLTVGDRVIAMGRSGITKDIPDGQTIQGFPAQEYKTEWKEQAVLRKWAKEQLKQKEKQK